MNAQITTGNNDARDGLEGCFITIHYTKKRRECDIYCSMIRVSESLVERNEDRIQNVEMCYFKLANRDKSAENQPFSSQSLA